MDENRSRLNLLFESWRRGKFAVFGKLCIFKTLATSKLVYIASIQCLPDKEHICKVKNSYFFSSGKNLKESRNTLIGDIIQGSLSVWVPRLVSSKSTLLKSKTVFFETLI